MEVNVKLYLVKFIYTILQKYYLMSYFYGWWNLIFILLFSLHAIKAEILLYFFKISMKSQYQEYTDTVKNMF
jgi:hypothetical protein